jgi:hypothetical protein
VKAIGGEGDRRRSGSLLDSNDSPVQQPSDLTDAVGKVFFHR